MDTTPLHPFTISKDLKDDEKKRNTRKRGIEADVRERLERLHVHCLLFVFGDKQAKQISRATKMNRRGWEPHLVYSTTRKSFSYLDRYPRLCVCVYVCVCVYRYISTSSRFCVTWFKRCNNEDKWYRSD